MPVNHDSELKCLILCAGLGTRLRPLTNSTPKPLATIHNVTLFEAAMRACLRVEASQFAINTHHLSAVMSNYANQIIRSLGLGHLYVSEEIPQILGTGGALVNIANWWGNQELLVYNGDVVSDIPLQDLVARHRSSSNIVTMAVKPLPPKDGGRSVWLGADGLVKHICKKADLPKTANTAELLETGFACAYIAQASLRKFLPVETQFFDVIDAFNGAISGGESIGAVSYQGFWADVGNPRSLWETNLAVAAMPAEVRDSLLGPSQRILASIPKTANVDDRSTIAPGASIGERAHIERSVLLNGAAVKPGEVLKDVLRGAGFDERFS